LPARLTTIILRREAIMANLTPMFASEANAARALDLSVKDFRALIEAGALPRPRMIGNHSRWDMAELQRIISGQAVEGLEGVKW
jgi:predicted DNA-binding transcriptional regulator AlpA